MQKIEHQKLLEIFEYDAATGNLIWKYRGITSRVCNTWNTRFAGKVAGHLHRSGYITIAVDGVSYRAHRLVWAFHHNGWPQEIDHENGVRSDNRIGNLRPVDDAENNKNMKLYANNKSGHSGVYKQGKFWGAKIGSKNKIYLGIYNSIEAAIEARKKAEVEFGYHQNHGRRVIGPVDSRRVVADHYRAR